MGTRQNRWTDSHWDTPPGVAIARALMEAARQRYDAVLQGCSPTVEPDARIWRRNASERDLARMNACLDDEAERHARLTSEYSVAECFLGTQSTQALAGMRLVVGVAAEDVAEAGIRAGDLLGEPDGVDYCPAPTRMADVWREVATLGSDHFGRIDGTAWVPDPIQGGSFTFVQGALGFIREFAPRIRRTDVRRWECRSANGDWELVELSRPGPLIVAGAA